MTGAVRSDWTKQDVLGTLRAIGPWWAQLLDDAHPAPAVASLAAVVEALGGPPSRPGAEVGALLAEVAARSAARHDEVQHGRSHDHDWLLLGARPAEVHLAAVHEAAVALRAASPRPVQHGHVAQLSASGGGVPKLPLAEAEVGERGLVADRQAVRRHHGRVWQAVSLWSVEVIDALAAEGHPVSCGAAGENLTLAGLDWTSVRAGAWLEVGEVHLEVSVFATPCATIAHCFVDRRFVRIDHDRHPGTSRVYASVLRPGVIRAGDPVVLRS